jgi:rfaE bifunctional protein kinase chain/domain
MNVDKFNKITSKYPALKIAVVGDFCLDRYLEIDPDKKEISIETGLPVYNVVNIRPQPGGAGTVVNNLGAVGIGKIYVVGLAGNDGEGWELMECLRKVPGVCLDYFRRLDNWKTFTYTKPLVIEKDAPPRELNRLDIKNWTSPSLDAQKYIIEALEFLFSRVDSIVFLEQVDIPETGVLTNLVLSRVRELVEKYPETICIGDSRQGLMRFPGMIYKMNHKELCALCKKDINKTPTDVMNEAAKLAIQLGKPVVVTISEQGIVAASQDNNSFHVPIYPVRGPVDIVGAGDAVTANFISSYAAGANLLDAITIANAAASVVIHKLGTTGTASIDEIRSIIFSQDR